MDKAYPKQTKYNRANRSIISPQSSSRPRRAQAAELSSTFARSGINNKPSDIARSASEDDAPISSSDDESGDEQTQRPYTTLLQTLSRQHLAEQHRRKRRRIEDGSNPHSVIDNQAFDTQPLIEANIEVGDEADGRDQHETPDVEDGEELSEDEVDTSEPFEKHLSDKHLESLNMTLESSTVLKWRKKLLRPSPDWKCLLCLPTFRSEVVYESRLPQDYTDLHLKAKLARSLVSKGPRLDGVTSVLAGQIFDYRDVCFLDRTVGNGALLRQLYCLHSLNHILKTRDRIIRDNARIAKTGDNDDIEYRDQGFTRPKILILLPTRQACVKVMDCIVKLLQPEQQENRKRFQEAFSQPDDLVGSDKPDDYRELFSGNDNDRFMIGVKITRKTVKFFSSFYNADLIIASPLGLYTKITTNDKKKRDWDFLSSIEILVVDQADALLMQNWENVETVLDHLNLEPKDAHGCDFARVRRWYLDYRARCYRQSLIFSAHNAPEINSLFERSMTNISGKTKISRFENEGVLGYLGVQVKQTFSRFEAPSSDNEPETRFNYFTASIVPMLSKISQTGPDKLAGTLIFIPSHMDFLRVQNYFAYSNDPRSVTFDPKDLPCISEYAAKSQNARAKSLFQAGRHPVLLYSGRAHHFYRYKLKGVRRVIMYGLPDDARFYQEIAGDYLALSVSEGRFAPEEASVQSLFSKYDLMKLERVVGTQRSLTMIKERGDIFQFF